MSWELAATWQEVPMAVDALADSLRPFVKAAAAILGRLVGPSGRLYVDDGGLVVVDGPDVAPAKLAACHALWRRPVRCGPPTSRSILIKPAAADWDVGRDLPAPLLESPASMVRALTTAALTRAGGVKTADWSSSSPSGAFLTAPIPVDSFNQAIWTDAVRPTHWISTNGSPGKTPPYVAATASSLLSSAAAGQPTVTPWQIGMAAAIGGGIGRAAGMTVGRTMGALGMADAATQAQLQQAGLWGGALTSVLSPFFR